MTARRRRVALVAAAASAVVLVGCSAGPSDADRAAWSAWSESVIGSAPDTAVGGMLAAVEGGPAATLDFAEPSPFRAVELRCIGADRAQFALVYTAGGQTLSTTQDIVCQQGALRTPIAIPTAVQNLTAVSVSATSPEGTGMWTAQVQH
ncbi:hypothetical protein [Microbacterium hominis]|uniref:hypothetical protein n=1 Tax=Microbacterium hominis TaxID=162426 RepID=UPI000ABDF3C3|nr:hypothetical protein [Microbacterium hominis]